MMIGIPHEPGASINVCRVHGGVVIVVPPNAPVTAETPGEVLRGVAAWLGAAVPPSGRYRWAASSFEVGVGAAFMCARVTRADVERGPAYIVTQHFGVPNSASQSTLWSALDVLERVNGWMDSVTFTASFKLDALRVVRELPWSAPDVFALRAFATSISATISSDPPADEPWTIAAEQPGFRMGVSDMRIVQHIRVALGSSLDGYFAARIVATTLEIGQHLPNFGDEPDDGEGDVPAFISPPTS